MKDQTVLSTDTAGKPVLIKQHVSHPWGRAVVGCGLVLSLVPLPGLADVKGATGERSLGTIVNGQRDGRCTSGLCQVSGGSGAGSNLFHRFSSFDTRGHISGVRIQSDGYRNVVVGVIDPLGTVLDKPIALSQKGSLYWLSPGGISLSSGARFEQIQRLQLSTTTGLLLDGGRFDVLHTSQDQIAALGGSPLPGSSAVVDDVNTRRDLGLNSAGDLVITGSNLTIDEELLLDANGGHLLVDSSQLVAPGGSIELQGQTLTARNSSFDVSHSSKEGGVLSLQGGTVDLQTSTLRADGDGAGGQIAIQANILLQAASLSAQGTSGGDIRISTTNHLFAAGSVDASGHNGRGGSISLSAGGNILESQASSIEATGASAGGSISVAADANLFSSGRYDVTATGSDGRGGDIELSGTTIDLRAAHADASGVAGGGTIHVGGGFQGSPLPSGRSAAQTTSISAASSLRADATATGNGGLIVVWSEQETRFAGRLSAHGGYGSGDGGVLEISGRDRLLYGGSADASAQAGSPGTLLLDPKNITIDTLFGRDGSVGYALTDLTDPNPNAGDQFGANVTVLANGNIVALDPFDDGLATDSGAAYLFDGQSGALLSGLLGSNAGDQVGSSGARALTNGNVVVLSPLWNASATVSNVGAVSWGDGRTGWGNGSLVSVSATNSLVGSTASDQIGSNGVAALSNGHYVVISPLWDRAGQNDVGAVSWGDGTVGVAGAVSELNSLVGSSAADQVGDGGVTTLSTGNYLVLSPDWDGPSPSGPIADVGAATWSAGDSGVRGAVSAANSLVGSSTADRVGSGGTTTLNNGNLVVISPDWNDAAPQGLINKVGAVTWVDGSRGLNGPVSSTNSLIGSTDFDFVGSGGVTALSNGHYVVSSPDWNAPALTALVTNVGAVTWGDGTNGTVGTVSASNSLTGSSSGDQVSINGITALPSGDYVVSSPYWNLERGASTWRNGSSSDAATISQANSLVGTTPGDLVGFDGINILSNGNYVVRSPFWNGSRGAATTVNGGVGISGDVSETNSLVGSTALDKVAAAGVTALSNGNYVVISPDWNQVTPGGIVGSVGAVTWGDGRSGISGAVGPANSLVGSTSLDQVGSDGVVPLAGGQFAVISPSWDQPGTLAGVTDAGAVTWGDGNGTLIGTISSANSLVGSSPFDRVGSGGVSALSNGNLVVFSPDWDAPSSTTSINDAGAVTWGNGASGLQGSVSNLNSLVGSSALDQVGSSGLTELTSGNYLVSSPGWDAGPGLANAGAITWGDANLGRTGTISSNNSLIGSNAAESLGAGGIAPLSGDRFALGSRFHDLNLNGTILIDAGQLQIVDANSYGYAVSAADELRLSPAQIEAVTNAGTALFLQANNDITLNPGSDIRVNNPNGLGGALTLQAGRSILIGSSISTEGSDITLAANQPAADPTYRDAGNAAITMEAGTSLDTGTGKLLITMAADGNTNPAGLVSLAALTGQTVRVEAANGLSLQSAVTANATSGNSIILSSGTGPFQNLAGPAALITSPGANWLVYSANPGNDNLGGLQPSYKQYAISLFSEQPLLGTGNGLLYSVSPLLSASLTGTVSRPYDGSTAINLTESNYAVGGLIAGDSIVLSPLTGALDDANVGSSKAVSVSGLTIDSATASDLGNIPVYGYQLSETSAAAAIATVTPKDLQLTLQPQTKTYDGTTEARLASSAYSLSGFINGQGAAINQTIGTYNSSDVLTANTISTSLTSQNYIATPGTDLSNYNLPQTALTSGSISPAEISVRILPQSKIYDGNTKASLTNGDYITSGFVNGQGATVTQTAGFYNSRNPQEAKTVTAELSGQISFDPTTLSSNYDIPANAKGPGTILPPAPPPNPTNKLNKILLDLRSILNQPPLGTPADDAAQTGSEMSINRMLTDLFSPPISELLAIKLSESSFLYGGSLQSTDTKPANATTGTIAPQKGQSQPTAVNVTSLGADEAQASFQSDEQHAQEQTTERLGINPRPDAVAPTSAQIQALLQKVIQLFREQMQPAR